VPLSQAATDLSRFVVGDASFFDTRDEALRHFGSFQYTLRGRAFEIVFGGVKVFRKIVRAKKR
jgi:hypothetical protein